MQTQFQSPTIVEHYGDEYAPEKEEHRIEAIKSFSMAQISAAPSIFRHCLKSEHISQSLSFLIPVAFAGSEMKESLRMQAQFKLFSMVEMLQKIKFTGESKKGFVEGTDKLWLSVANAKIHSLIKENEESLTIAKQQKKILKFIKTQVTPLRISLFAKSNSETVLEKKVAAD